MIKLLNILLMGAIDKVYQANLTCTIVNSRKHGTLTVRRNPFIDQNCDGKISFEKTETGEMFCLKKGGKSDELACQSECKFIFLFKFDLIKMVVHTSEPETMQSNCKCGLENAPSIANNIGGGEEVYKNQYPWHAVIAIYKEEKG